ncbi:GDSL-type esterase/lipase family protein [Stieleria sp. JC731]|uniref:PVC-type heme-binding CxxCH protein n=1 Tax=Pirellulaceae TaxID=2691357 RepID=UPI001E2AE9CE|nr:PVC-type heme-binding CxxCH protein [Stieleria sp. JC731]MCC9603257.1 GDSL-type esterase/lipase family protein [Stieleria sp. JC731]
MKALHKISRRLIAASALFGLCGFTIDVDAADLKLQKGDHICLVGNALGERMQVQNEWESLLHTRYPNHNLVVRNLCFPADEINLRIRSKNFGTPQEHLTHSQASVVMYFLGYNESFAGEDGLKEFKTDLTKLVAETLANDFGKGRPQVVLVSPIAFEGSDDPDLSDGQQQNANLEIYTHAMSQVASETGVVFVDLFHPTDELFGKSDAPLTINGFHLNDAGYQKLAPILDEALFGNELNVPVPGDLKAEIDNKNFHWFHRYRAVNGFSIYGDRGLAGSDGTYNNRDVMERELSILDQMTANRDARIWAVAAGKPVADQIDDSSTLPFIEPKTNVGIPGDKNAKAGKLGTLQYLPASEQIKLFDLAEGFEIQLIASEEQFPELSNPVALNFDSRGRLWVATMKSYPHWQPKSPMDDKLLIFEDTDGDHDADVCKVFADNLHQPTGFELGHGGAYVSRQPDIWFMKDTDGDDKADETVRQIVGMDSADSHHGIAAFEWGPGGNLYFQEGTFKFSAVETPYGPRRCGEAGIWKYNPRTQRMDVHCNFAFANPWGYCYDRWGQDFIGDASPGFSYWAAPITGHIEYPNKHPGGSQHRRVAELGGGDPQYRHPTFYPKRIRPLAGCAIVSSRHFPEQWQGNFLVTNVIGERAILNHQIRESEEGSGFVGEEKEALLSCRDGNFRPVDMQFAPDGSLYIVDWHNALIGHLQHNLREPHRDHSHGRIWRVTCKDRPLLEPAKIEGEPIAALLELLKSPEDRTRYRARRELAARSSEEVIASLESWIESLDASNPEIEHHQMEALWMYQTHNQIHRPLLDKLSSSDNHRARAACVRLISHMLHAIDDAADRIAKAINDKHPTVRLEGVRAASFLNGESAVEMALGVLEYEMDDYLQYTLDETMRALEEN